MAIMFERFWIVLLGTFSQILPRIDLNLCLNQDGQIGLIAIPDLIMSKTLAESFCTSSTKGSVRCIALVNRFEEKDESSYLMPIVITSKQKSKLDKITKGLREHQLGRALKSEKWNKIVSEIRANNINCLRDISYRNAISRICITDNLSPEEPDDFQELPGFEGKASVFLYSSPDIPLSLSREQLGRELSIRLMFSNESLEIVTNTIRRDRHWMSYPDNHPFIHTVNRVEAELRMNYDKQKTPSMTNILLDPALSNFTPKPSPTFTPTAKGLEVVKLLKEDQKTGFSIVNWGEPNIAQVTQHVFYSENASHKDTAISPAITVFSDEMGCHTMPTEIFRIDTKIFSLSNVAEVPVSIDELEPAQIPEIDLGSVSDLSSEKWWQKDTIAKKILWLVANYFAMHTVEKPDCLLFSVTPILDNAIQIVPLFEELGGGVPYAYVVIKGDSMIDATPVFATGMYRHNPEGSLTLQTGHFMGKYYAISVDGNRIDTRLEIRQFIKPIYSTIISGKYKEPKVYATKGWLSTHT